MASMDIDIGGKTGTIILGVEKGSGLTIMHGPHGSVALLVVGSNGESATIVLDEAAKRAALAYISESEAEGT